MLWLWLNFTPILLSNIHSVWEKIPSLSSTPILYAFHHLLLSFSLGWGEGGGRRLHIFAWYIFKLEVSKLRVRRSTIWKKKRNNTFSFLLGPAWEGTLMTSHNEERGWISAREEREKLVFLECRQNSREQGPFSGILCSSEFCISVHKRYTSLRRANGKVETLNFFLNLCYPPSTRFLLITMNIVIWY